jgi:pimeloyl-ACP methyl ester carboxylesterase
MDYAEFQLRQAAKRHNRRSLSNELFSIVQSTFTSIENIEIELFNHVKTPVKREYVHILDDQFKIWTLSANTDSPNTPLVMIHGLFGCIGIWLNNIDELSKSRPLYALDLIGFGRSSRPTFSEDPKEAETQFVDTIEEWRQKMGLEKFILLGHSFGGFLTAAYALKYPQYVQALILVDPWGFTKRDEDDDEPPLIKAFVKITDYISPLFPLRATGLLGASVMKKVRPEFRDYYYKTLGDSDLIYNYLYQCNSRYPK